MAHAPSFRCNIIARRRDDYNRFAVNKRRIKEARPAGRAPVPYAVYRSQSGFDRPCTPDTIPMDMNSITSDEPP